MRRGSRNKRTSATRHADRSVFSLMVHGPEFGSELVINPDCFPDIKVNDLLEIAQPDREHQRLVLQVTSRAPVKGKLQVSVLKDIATQFGLDVFYNVVVVQRVDPREVALDFLELSLKDQFLSRADIWRFKVAMLGKCVHVGKNVETLGIRAQVEGLFANKQDVLCGVVGPETKIIADKDTGIIVDDFIATLKRKAKQAGLELRRVPEYARISFLQIHPLVAPIYFPMPLTLTQKLETEKTLMDALVNRLGFVLDDERVADSVGIGYGLGLGQDERPMTASGYRCWASRLRMKGSPPLRSSTSDSRAAESVCKRGYVQVMHRQAPVFLRLIHNGLVWIPSYDYDQLSNPELVQALFTDIVQLIETSSTHQELVSTCCGSEAA
ncbi:hypothetical protein P43SY_001666 [Pythium insidiosum]|uniref:Uncharacterized protein n=1 Tax=Pythium insidiosum TaxID=114742 RepID=A0AAD5LGG2_PYTIN|nr:hypothetical protein P43SY_001666 [Pythium insidiosum]